MRGVLHATARHAVSLVMCLILASAWAAPPDGFSEIVVQVQVNEAAASEMVVALRDANQNIWIDADDFAHLRLRTPEGQPLIVDGVRFFSLQSIPGASISFDEANLRLAVTVPATAFMSTSVALSERPRLPIPQANFGGFFNYELSGEHDRSTSSEWFGAAFAELGFFGPHGVITNSAIDRAAAGEQHAIRLESTWVYDFPERMRTLRVGDAISGSTPWSRSVRFAGLQFGSNFALRPDLVTSPLLSVAGEAVVPSTVDVFVNNQHVTNQQVPAGPFVIDRLPAISGSGDVRLVVRDAFGREQVISAPFYSTPVLLQAGLAQYSAEVGKVRENYAIESNNYGPVLGSVTYRRGITDAVTLEAHVESQQSGPHAFGLDGAIQIGNLGLVSAAIAQGGDNNDSGVLASIGFERGGRRFSINARSQFAADGFRQVGDTPGISRPKQQHVLQTSANFYDAGSLSLAYAVATYANEPRREVGTLSHNISLRNFGYLSFSVSHTWSGVNSTSAFLIFTAPLGATRSASLSARYDKDEFRDEHEIIATFQDNPPVGNGSGYRLSASTAGNYSGSYLRQFDSAAFSIEAAKYLETRAERATLSGAAVVIGGDVYATRSVNDSFALVDIAAIPDIDVMVDNQVVRRTDNEGRALIRNLRAYDANRLSIDPRQLPLDTRIDSDKLTIAPRYRSGVVVKFPVTRERGGTFTLVLPDGKPVPSGAVVIFKGNRFPVALDGLVYVTGLDHGMPAEAEWMGGHCTFRVAAPIGNEPLPDLGTIVCRLAP